MVLEKFKLVWWREWTVDGYLGNVTWKFFTFFNTTFTLLKLAMEILEYCFLQDRVSQSNEKDKFVGIMRIIMNFILLTYMRSKL